MKIAYVVINANRREGTSRAVLEVAERLSLDYDVDLVARTTEDADLDRVRWRRVAGPGWPEAGDYGSFVLLADRLLKRGGYDIIHSAGPNCSAADVYTIQTVHSVKRRIMQELGAHDRAGTARRLTRALYDKMVLSIESRAYRSANARGRIAYLPVSQGTRAELEAEYPVGDALVEEVPNGADLDRFHPFRQDRFRHEVRERHGLSRDDFVLVFSGGDWVRKGLRIAAEAVAKVKMTNVKLLVVGRDPLEDEFRRSLNNLRLEDRICFAGFQREVENYYAAGDAFVFPTAYEAFSLATIEAAASGLPVLMPDVSGAAELVGSGEAGCVVERNSDAFAEAIARLASEPDGCKRMGLAARRIVEQRFSWDVIAASTERVYETLLASRRAGEPLREQPRTQTP